MDGPRLFGLSTLGERGTLRVVVTSRDRTSTEPAPSTLFRRPSGRPVVSPGTISKVRAIAEAVFCSEDGPPPAERLDWVSREVEDFLARCGNQSRLVFSLMVFVASVIAPLLIGRLSSLRALPLDERIRALTVLERRFGEPLLAVKAILCLIYYEHPDSAREVGFDGRCMIATKQQVARSITTGMPS